MSDKSTTAEQDRIRTMLKHLLDSNEVSYDSVLDVAKAIEAQDAGSVRFSVDAALIDRLGYELVTHKETAAAELIKNAFDADASEVELHFVFPETKAKHSEPKGPPVASSLTIRDDGYGMTRDELVNGFMRLSTGAKVDLPRSPHFRRQRAGRKGIGRFAAQRLGRNLLIETRSPADAEGYRIEIKWADFRQDTDLNRIASKVSRVNIPRGTKLTISELRDEWTEESIVELEAAVAPTVQPFTLLSREIGGKRDDNFKIVFKIGTHEPTDVQSEIATVILDNALAKIEGSVDSAGKGVVKVSSSRLGLSETFDILQAAIEVDGLSKPAPFRYLRNIRFVAYYYNLYKGYFPSGLMTTVRAVLKAQGGVRVYRNGFRVVPYGDQNNDWLGLDAYYGMRSTLLEPFGNLNFIGLVELTDPNGELFQEPSSREGLIEGQPLAELVQFVFDGLLRSIQQVRGKKEILTGQKGPDEKVIQDKLRRIQRSASALKSANTVQERNKLVQALQADARGLARDFKKQVRNQLQELEMLRILASLGISISSFIHEIAGTINSIETDVRRLAKNTRGTLNARLDASMNLLNGYTSYIQEVATENSRRDLKRLEMHAVLNEFETLAKAICEERGIKYAEPILPRKRLYCQPMHQSEWSAILLNLLSNSVKAIKRADVKGIIQVEVREEGKRIALFFSDNGDGIPPENYDKVFRAFFSTSTSATREKDIGMGLGLKIVYDIVASHNGRVEIAQPTAGFSTNMAVSMPADQS